MNFVGGDYKIQILEENEYKNGFHQWVDGKEILGIFNVSNGENCYYLVFINWMETYVDYYIIVFSQNKTKILVELHKINESYDFMNIEWRYKPSKRDGRNKERKKCFKSYYGDTIKKIEVPNDVEHVKVFLNDIFELLDIRIKSDEVIAKEELKRRFLEGKLYEKVHRRRERSDKLVKLIKSERMCRENKLICEICGFNFYETYKELGKGFIEAHHIIPIGELKEESETKKEDIVLVCSNCHSMIHRKRPCLTINEIKKIMRSS